MGNVNECRQKSDMTTDFLVFPTDASGVGAALQYRLSANPKAVCVIMTL
jgi:hypothetical protein